MSHTNITRTATNVEIDVEEFTAHHDECLAIADALFILTSQLAAISLPMATNLTELANRLDKSISKLPVNAKAAISSHRFSLDKHNGA